MKYILLIGDGMADLPIEMLQGKTPLAFLALPEMAVLASQYMGLARTVPEGTAPGSDTAILSIFGSDPRTCYTGRAALEAAGAHVPLLDGETVWRVNLVTVEGGDIATARMRSHNGYGIHGDLALQTVRALLDDSVFANLANALGFVLHPSPTFRQMGVAPTHQEWGLPLPGPHDHLGEPIDPLLPEGNIRKLVHASFQALQGHQANCIWPWAPGAAMQLPDFHAKYHHHGPVISAVPLCKGIACLSSLPAPDIEGLTGELDTNYEAKVDAALQSLSRDADFAVIHVEAPDECSHMKDLEGKLEAIQRIDARIIAPLLKGLRSAGEPFRVLFLPDHYTFVSNGVHDGTPVPFCLYDSRKSMPPRVFCEAEAAKGPFYDGMKLMELLFSET